MSRLEILAERVVSLPTPTERGRLYARDAGLDLLGCVLAGTDHPYAVGARRALGGYPGAAPLYGTGQRAAAPFAALCNAVASHAYDFDDWEEPGNTHPSAVVFPALWALAAERGGASGEDVLTAYAAGFEVIARLGEALNFEHYNQGWHSTATLGVIGAAGACARLLGLDAARAAQALSLAISQASGYTCQFGSAAKPLQAGFAARDGLTAALLAEQGLTGQVRVLDAPTGFAALTSGVDPARLDTVFGAMNKTETTETALDKWGVVLKPYPSCGYTHRLIDCALDLHGRVAPDAIVSIRAELPDFHYAILAFDRPADRSQALFSAPFTLATALLRGRFEMRDLNEENRSDPALRALIDRVEMAPQHPRRPELNYDPDQPDRVSVALRSGETLSAECAFPTGAPQNPMSHEQLTRKFSRNAAAVFDPLPNGALDALAVWDQADAITAVLDSFGGHT